MMLTDDTLERRLNELHERLDEERNQTAVNTIIDVASRIHGALDDYAWQSFAAYQAQCHPLHDLLIDDPLTHRAFEKPRGYPGDAVMLDMVYFGNAETYRYSPDIPDVGKVIFETLVAHPTASAIRERRRVTARAINQVADRVDQPTVTSIACGHMRETNLSEAVKDRRIESVVGLDQDIESLRTVEFATESNPVIQTKHGSVTALLRENVDLQATDLIYAAGLFDYLPRSTATTLVSRLFENLNPGGRLLVGNLAPDHDVRGYLEAFMDWWLEYRTEEDMYRLAVELPDDTVESLDVWTGENGVVLYLDVHRTP